MTDIKQEREYLTISEFCQRYGMSRSWYFKNRVKGRVPQGVAINGRVRKIPVQAADEWFEQFRKA